MLDEQEKDMCFGVCGKGKKNWNGITKGRDFSEGNLNQYQYMIMLSILRLLLFCFWM